LFVRRSKILNVLVGKARFAVRIRAVDADRQNLQLRRVWIESLAADACDREQQDRKANDL